MRYQNLPGSTPTYGIVRTLRQQEELPLLRDHLLRLDRESRYNRFNGFIDDAFIERYAAKCADDDTIIIGYVAGGMLRGAAELHPPGESQDLLPEVAFSVEACVRRQGVGSKLFEKLITEARAKGYRNLTVTTGAQNQAMRALANKFGAHLTFVHDESSGTIDLTQRRQSEFATLGIATPVDAARVMMNFNRACWKQFFRMYGLDRAA